MSWPTGLQAAQYVSPRTGLPTYRSRSLSLWPADLLREPTGAQVFCPGPNQDTLAIAAMRAGLVPHLVSSRPPVLTSLWACSVLGLDGGAAPFTYEQADPYSQLLPVHADPPRYQYGLLYPQMGMRPGTASAPWLSISEFGSLGSEGRGVELAIRQVDGRAVIAVPMGFLFRSGAEQKLREHLVERGFVETVIAFPGGLLKGTALPFALLVLSRDLPRHSIKFCTVREREDLSGQGKLRSHDRRFIGAGRILRLLEQGSGRRAAHRYRRMISAVPILTPGRYLSKAPEFFTVRQSELKALAELVTIIKPQLLPEVRGGDVTDVQKRVQVRRPALVI